MYFKRLEMHGFKSFADPVIMDFHEGITCIVGPNGSGKSNVSDALRWVLGEQSPKALRGGKMEEVIFNGTENRRPRGMAEVTLVIDNSAGILDIEYKEVAITRRMYRSGESEYLINNNPCRLKDIRELIMDTGIGVDGYSIIGQGKIADIVGGNKPESRREIFEEAAGIVAYKTRKAEAERKLNNTKGNLERIDDIIGEIEGRIGGLEEESTKAQRYLTLRERFQELEVNITLRNIENAEKRGIQYKSDAESMADQIHKLENQKLDHDKEQNDIRSRSSVLDELNEKAHGEKLALIDEINQLSSQSALNKEKLAAFDRDEQRLNGEIADLSEKLESQKAEEQKLTDERLKIRIALNEAQKTLTERISIYDEMSSETSRFTELMDSSNEQIINLSGKASSKRSEANSYENFKVTLKDRKEEIDRKNREILEEKAGSEKDLAEKQAAYDHIKVFTDQYHSIRSADEAEHQKLTAREADLARQIETLKIDCSSTESRYKTMEELEQNHDGYNNAVKYIMRMGLKGVTGVVGEMMKVPAGYETAIETALGAAMQNVITEDDEAAKRAITVLKVNKSGRLTFLPAASIRGRRQEPDYKIAQDSRFRGMGVDLVSFDEKYRNIFDYLLGRVAIVENLDAAVQMSKQMRNGVRFVTLDGEVINASGAITGGKFKHQSAGLLQRRNEIDKLKAELDRKSESLSKAAGEYMKVKEDLGALEDKMRADRDSMKNQELDQATLREQIVSLTNNLEDLDDDLERNQNEIADIEKQLADVDRMIASMVSESKEAEEEINRITAEMDKLSEEHQEKKDAVDQASDGITDARIQAASWKDKSENIEGLIQRVKESIEEIGFQIEDKEEDLENIRKQREELGSGDSDADHRVEELEKERDALDVRIAEISKEKEAQKLRLNEIAEATSQAEKTLNNLRDQKYQMEIRLAKNETQLDNMKERLWEEFEITYAQALDRRSEDFVMSNAQRESRDIKNELKEIGDVNVGSIEEYAQVSQRYEFLTSQRDDVVTAMNELESIISDLDRTINKTFRDTFNEVEVHFESVFKELFGGGHAELRMENEKDPLESGIDIVAQPPGKRLQNLNLMSGGEKTMTAIALMFAVLKTKPTPFCILDEVEAALDDDNIYKFSRYLKHFATTQFALITHQKATMETADVLYGITMPEQGVSKMLSLRMGDYNPDDYIN